MGCRGSRCTSECPKLDNSEEAKRLRIEKCKSFLKKLLAFLFSHIGLIGLVVGYSALGAWIFEELEGPRELKVKEIVNAVRGKTVRKLWNATRFLNVMDHSLWVNSADAIFQEFQTEIYLSTKELGWDGSHSVSEQQWTFAGSLLYALTTITTIGYGHIAPKTSEGRVATMIYAIIGIPLTLLCLANIGEVLGSCFKLIYSEICCGLCRLYERRKAFQQNLQESAIKTKPKKTKTFIRSCCKRKPREPAFAGFRNSSNAYRLSLAGRKPSSDNTTTPPIYRKHQIIQSVDDTTCTKSETKKTREKETSSPKLQTVDPVDKSTCRKVEVESGKEILNPTPQIGDTIDGDTKAGVKQINAERPKAGGIPLVVSVTTMVTYILGGSLLFTLWENNWDFLEGTYFCFVTLSTIGFGDFVPGTSFNSWSTQEKLILCSLYLLFGLALIAMCFDLMKERVQCTFKNIATRLGLTKEKAKQTDVVR